MPGVGQQRHGIGEKAINGLDDDETRVEGDADGESPAEILRRVRVARAVAMSMVVVAAVVMIVIVRVAHGGKSIHPASRRKLARS